MNTGNKSLSINETYILESIDNADILSACTALYTSAILSCSDNTGILLHNGVITFNGYITAPVISGGTFYGDGSHLTGLSTQDTFVTGGTYSNGIATFTNNTGGTFNVSGFYTGYTVPTDVFVTGGTFNSVSGIATFTNNTGGTFNVNGFENFYTTGATLIDKIVYFNRNDTLSAYTLNLSGFSSAVDTYVTGGTYSDGTTVFTNNTGGTFNVTGFSTGYTLTFTGITDVLGYTPLSAYTNTYVTGGTYSDNTFTYTNNTGGTFNVLFNTMTGLTVDTISATTYLGLPKDIFVTGGTYNNGTATFRNNTNTTFSVTGFTKPFNGGVVSGLTATTISATTYENLPKIKYVINVAKEGGNFTSIKDAVDSITDSNSQNRYVIKVAPGRYVEDEIILQGKEFVSIVGTDILETLVVAVNPTQNIFRLGNNNELSFMTISGASSGVGIVCYNLDGFSLVHKISMYDCDTNVLVQSDSVNSNFYGEYVDFNGAYSYGIRILAYNNYVAYANMENYYNFPSGPNVTIANSVQGSGATLSVFVGDGIGNSVAGSTNYELSDYASLNMISTTADLWDYDVRVLNVGGPSTFDIDAHSVVRSGLYDFSIEHPQTFGTFNGSLTQSKIHSLSENVYWSFLDSTTGDFELTRKISVTFQDGTHTDTSTLIFEGSAMGLIDGGILSVVSGLTVNVSSGFGYLEQSINNEIYQKVVWPSTNITLSPNTDNYLFFNENNILSISGGRPDTTTNIVLGKVVTDNSSVLFIDSSPLNADHTSNRFASLFRNALGPIYSTGSLVVENVTPFKLNVGSGIYYFSTNKYLPSGGTAINFTQFYTNGIGGWNTSVTDIVNHTQYDNNGTLTGLTLSAYTKHTLYVVGQGIDEKYMLVLGQTQYNDLVTAEGADLPTPPPYFNDSVAPIASIFIQQGYTGITQIKDIRPVIGFKAGGISASAIHGNLLGLSADDHKQYLLVDGSRAMSGNLSMGGNNIYSAGTINGVTIESHASRHKNGGDDEISTDTPAPSQIPKSDTFGKLDTWISDASSSVKGLINLSFDPDVSTNPIAVGVNDPRFLSSITGVTNTGNTLTFTNNGNGSIVLNELNLENIEATTISATTYVNLPKEIFVRNKTYSFETTTITVNQSIFNPSNLNVLNTSIFIIDTDADYYVLGDLTNNGVLVVNGTLKIGGELYNYGTITGSGIIE